MSRTVYIDNLKIVLTVMVILLHTAVACPMTHSLLVALSCSFIFLSGFLAGPSFEKKEPEMWLAGRILLLGIPLMIGLTVLPGGPGGRDNAAFLAMLLLLDLAYFICRLMVKKRWLSNLAVPAPHFILLFAIALGMGCFLAGAALACTSYFILGTVAYKNNWLGFLSYKTGKRLGLEIILLALVYPAFSFVPPVFLYGFHWQALLFSVWEQMMSISIIVSLICFAKKFLDKPLPFNVMPGRTTFVVFIIHPLVIAGFSFAFTHSWPINGWSNFFIIVPLSVAGSFLLAAALTRATQTYLNQRSQ